MADLQHGEGFVDADSGGERFPGLELFSDTGPAVRVKTRLGGQEKENGNEVPRGSGYAWLAWAFLFL